METLVLSLCLLLCLDGAAYMTRGLFPSMKPFPVTRFIVRLTRRTVGGLLQSAGKAIAGGKPRNGNRRR